MRSDSIGAAALVVAAGIAQAGSGEGDRPVPREFWAYQPPAKTAPPAVEEAAWPRNAIDHFVLARLEQVGLSPSQEAGEGVLRRRLAYDLTGMPVDGQAAGSYEEEVERLLGSEAFGERMAAMWLGVARYAEDQAHQVGDDTKFFYPNAFRYRRWVIDAFNRDLGYDAFLRLQLAADLYGAEEDDLPALGFIGLGPKYYNRGRLAVQAEEWEDRVDVFSRGLLGLTVACARCHDHKYDAVSMADYYGLAGVFASTEMVDEPWKTDESGLDEEEKKKNLHTIHIVEDGEVRDLPLYERGNVDLPGEVVPRRYLEVLSPGGAPVKFGEGSGRRELAELVVATDNPLTARVMVNRVWALLVGRGLVGTPSNFGTLGERPSHPELLDWLAVDFMENGWSVKSLVRQIVGSATYRQASLARAENVGVDEANRLLWRAHRKRVPVEMLRDTLLAASGMLEAGGGRSTEASDPENRRRTVYSRVSRLSLDSTLQQFDFPDANVHCAQRSVTTTPTQKLWLMNSAFTEAAAGAMAERLEEVRDERARVENAFSRLFGRVPDVAEMEMSLDLLGKSGGGREGLTTYCHALMLSNEMLYID